MKNQGLLKLTKRTKNYHFNFLKKFESTQTFNKQLNGSLSLLHMPSLKDFSVKCSLENIKKIRGCKIDFKYPNKIANCRLSTQKKK